MKQTMQVRARRVLCTRSSDSEARGRCTLQCAAQAARWLSSVRTCHHQHTISQPVACDTSTAHVLRVVLTARPEGISLQHLMDGEKLLILWNACKRVYHGEIGVAHIAGELCVCSTGTWVLLHCGFTPLCRSAAIAAGAS